MTTANQYLQSIVQVIGLLEGHEALDVRKQLDELAWSLLDDIEEEQ